MLFRACLYLGVVLLTWITGLLIGGALCLTLRWPLELALPVALIFTLVIAIGCAVRLFSRPLPMIIVGCSLTIIVVSASIAFSGTIYDRSWDGQTYHAEAIHALTEGWSPFASRSPENAIYGLFISFYTKGHWITAATMNSITGDFEHGKAINPILWIAGVLISAGALGHYSQQHRSIAAGIGVIMALNPLSLYQITSYYADGQVAIVSCILAITVITLYRKTDPVMLFTLAISLLLLFNLKLNAALWIGVLIGGFALFYLWKRGFRPARPIAITVIGASLIAIAWIGFNPYLSQYVYYTATERDPFYPTQWQTLTVIDYNTPTNWIGRSAPDKLWRSLFGQSQATKTDALIKLPFTLTDQEWLAFAETDPRVAGFGPLFSAVLILTTIGLLWAIVRRRSMIDPALITMIVLIGISVLINPEAWWARYVPQLWLIPPIGLLILLMLRPSRLMIMLGAGIVLLLVINITGIAWVWWEETERRHTEIAEQYAYLATLPGPIRVDFNDFIAPRIRFEQFGIAYQSEQIVSCDRPYALYATQTVVCLPNTLNLANSIAGLAVGDLDFNDVTDLFP
ncbi:MAG: hypothetical protein MUF87_09510 [Anaerolineae bacterium]|jgi:hypothetical protein|nr:hypothetical protein [Anaerolineae bacterium]